ncbi:hypothetical protein [Nostoc sp.]
MIAPVPVANWAMKADAPLQREKQQWPIISMGEDVHNSMEYWSLD